MTDARVAPRKHRLIGGAAVLVFGVAHGVHDSLGGDPIVRALLPTVAMAVQVVLLSVTLDLAERRAWSFRLKATVAVLVSLACGVLIRPLHWKGPRDDGTDWMVSLTLGLGVLMLWLLMSYFPLQLSRARARALAAESQQRKAELERLRSHLHPHFLLNTLNAVAGLLTVNPGQARQLIVALGDLLRDALEDQNGTRSLGDEVAWLRRYAQIFEIRHAGAIRFEWDVADETSAVPLPRLLLQPLLENAIEHGALRRRDGVVRISSRREPGGTVIIIADNGPGMPTPPLAPQTGLGLRLARDRLELAYPEATLTLASSSDGTCVSLRLPASGVA
jgi:signal transduction histidine kinase